MKPIFLGGDGQAECVQLAEAGIEWQGIEVVSKILTAGEESFKEVCNVVNLLDHTFMSEMARKVSTLLLLRISWRRCGYLIARSFVYTQGLGLPQGSPPHAARSVLEYWDAFRGTEKLNII